MRIRCFKRGARSGSTGCAGVGDTEGTWQGRDEVARTRTVRKIAWLQRVAAADLGSGVRGRFPGVLVWISVRMQSYGALRGRYKGSLPAEEGRDTLFEADIRGYFNHIQHEWLQKMVAFIG